MTITAEHPAGTDTASSGTRAMLPGFTTFAEITPLATEATWEGYWPRGEVVGLYGEGGIGKGRSEIDLAARITRGDPMPFTTTRTRPGSVILILPEDHPQEQVRPRLDAAGADVTRVIDMTRMATGTRFKLSAAVTRDGHVGQLRDCVETLRNTCAACRKPMTSGLCPACGGTEDMNPRLVIIDPLSAVIGWGSISTVPGARRAIEPLQDLAQSTGVTVLLVMHTTKDGELQGSAGVRQALRILYKIAKDVNPAVRVISLDKANNQGETPDAKFTLEGTPDGVRVVWLDRAEQDRRNTSWRSPAAGGGQGGAAEGWAAIMAVQDPWQPAPDITTLAVYSKSGRGEQLARTRCEAHPRFSRQAPWQDGEDGGGLSRYETADGTVIRFAVLPVAS